MKSKLLLLLFMSMFLTSFTLISSQESDINRSDEFGFDDVSLDLEKMFEESSEIDNFLQENEVIIPSSLRFILKDGNIGMEILMEDDSVRNFHIIIEERKIKRFLEGSPEKSNYDLLTDEKTINEIAGSEDVAGEIISAYNQKKIVIKANGLTNNVRLFFGKMFVRIFS